MAFVERPPESYSPDEEEPFRPWQFNSVEYDQNKAREAYIGTNHARFIEMFESFEDYDGFRFSFLWAPLVFGPLWFAYRRMYVEGIALFVVGFALKMLFLLLMGTDWYIWLAMNIVLSLTGGWAYYRKVEQQIEKAFTMFADDPLQAIGWLRRNGDGDFRLAGLLAVAGLWLSLLKFFI